MQLDILRALNAERAARRAAVVVTDMASGEQRLVKAADVARDPLREVIEKHIRRGKSGMAETPAGKVFLTVHVPPSQLVITGAVHISQALARDCFYIGALGSKKTHGRRVERLKAQGLSDAALARIHAPIGLDIGAVSPSEIAVAIMGEITAQLRQSPEQRS